METAKILNKIKIYFNTIIHNKIFLFYVISIIYMELIYALWIFKSIGISIIFPTLFSLSAGGIFTLLSTSFSEKVNKVITISFLALLGFTYSFYLVYYQIFKTTFSLYSLVGAKDAMQFGSIIKSSILGNIVAIILLFVPLALLAYKHNNISFKRKTRKLQLLLISFTVLFFVFALAAVHVTAKKPNSQHTLYYKASSPHLMVKKLGLLTTIRIDFKRLVLGFNTQTGNNQGVGSLKTLLQESFNRKYPKFDIETNYNVMDISFLDLLATEKNNKILDMHMYFSSVKPTTQNEYTGMFKDHNLILITAEAFYPYTMSKELTPTLYKMANEGFVFNNFYNPLWGVSTSDGEYAVCTGLVPKAGVWSMSNAGRNDMRFALGNQFRRLGYLTKAYHNHTYNYYNRHISHPNLGYEYKGIGNGLKISPAWPESDLELIEQSIPEYISDKPFHVYYMTVSGHFEYNFVGNHMSIKNKKYVDHLDNSDKAKAYIACNLELEFAMSTLLEGLEKAGVAEKTVIAISPDHYPYGLPKANIDELTGHTVEENFELYKASFILWKKGMKPIVINKPCSSVDILPTLSNLFGIEYDSRLLVGKDILSSAKPLIVFNNRSWITDKGKFNALTGEFFGAVENMDDYINAINKNVEEIFKYSADILDTNYYNKVFE